MPCSLRQPIRFRRSFVAVEPRRGCGDHGSRVDSVSERRRPVQERVRAVARLSAGRGLAVDGRVHGRRAADIDAWYVPHHVSGLFKSVCRLYGSCTACACMSLVRHLDASLYVTCFGLDSTFNSRASEFTFSADMRLCEKPPQKTKLAARTVPYLIGAPLAAAYTTGIGYQTFQNASFPLRSLLPSRAVTLDFTATMAFIANRPMAARTVFPVPSACLSANADALAPVAVAGGGAVTTFRGCLNPSVLPVNQAR
jgi:hypothetical protein